jgi:hypothetical protein
MPLVFAALDWSSIGLDWSMRSVYIVCALLGGTVLLVQTALLFFGVGDSHPGFDFHSDTDIGDGSFGLLSTKAVSAFLTFFGLSGFGALEAGWGRGVALGVGVLAGLAIMVVVVWLLRMQMRLASQGNLDPKQAIGTTATVYLRIPERRSGQGKVTVSLQGRSQEFLAVTGGPAIPTGDTVRLVSMPTAGLFEVVSLKEE